MKNIDIRLSSKDIGILSDAVGKTMISIEHDEFTFTNTSSQVVRFNCGNDGFYLYSFTEPLDYFGSLEDVAVWSIDREKYPIVANKSFISMPVEQEIKKIVLVQENQKMFMHDLQTYDIWLTRGIILDFGDHEIAFEKPVWFSENIVISKGYDLLDTFRSVEEIMNPENWREDISVICQRITECI